MQRTQRNVKKLTHFFLKDTIVLIHPDWPKIMSERKMYPIVCSDCGKDSEVPFEPKTDRPVYCRECLPKHRSEGRRY